LQKNDKAIEIRCYLYDDKRKYGEKAFTKAAIIISRAVWSAVDGYARIFTFFIRRDYILVCGRLTADPRASAGRIVLFN